MSSIASSQFKYDDQSDGIWPNIESPWYPTFGHPLIYYSQVQPVRRWQRSREIVKNKPNCFKKAFRWYTQEHNLIKNGRTHSSSNISHADLKSFAAWLDEKYDEFLHTNQTEKPQYIWTQTSAVEIDKTAKCKPVAKKHKRLKSPWKKCRKYLDDNGKNKGKVIMKSNQSIEVILNPKNLSRPASECCQRTKAQSCCNRSSSAVASNKSTLQTVAKRMSQSLTSFVKEKEIYVIPLDAPEYGVKKDYKYDKYPNKNVPKKHSTRKSRKSNRAKNVSCQCSKHISGKVDKSTQIENKGIKGMNVCGCDDKYLQKLLTTDNKTNVTMPIIAPECLIKMEESVFMPKVTGTEKNRTSFLAPVNDGVQTSDHSINLNQAAYTEYPLLMKIICSDKLKYN